MAMEGEGLPARLLVMKLEELVLEIMVWVAARHIRRFEFVNRQWQLLLSSRHFVNRHNRHNCIHRTSETAFIIYNNTRVFCFYPITRELDPFTFHNVFTRILLSSHGLMLLECRESTYPLEIYYCVANPLTRKVRKLPVPNNPSEFFKTEPVFLEYDPLKSVHYEVGFLMYRPRTDHRVSDHSLDVYDSESRQWKRTDLSFDSKFEGRLLSMLDEDHIRMWFNRRVYSSQPGGRTFFLDLENLNVGTIQVPSFMYSSNLVIGWNGGLHCISIYSRGRARTMYVYKLTEESLLWSQILRVDLNRASLTSSEMKGKITVLGIAWGDRDDEDDYSILFNVAGKIFSYSNFDCTFEDLLEGREDDQFSLGRNDFHQFNETLAFV